MPIYRCPQCGKSFNPEKLEICPRCGGAVAPSVMTRVERKQTAERLRAEGKMNYDEHCHEDDAWKDSYGASTHRAAVRAHESTIRAGYRAHSPADNPNANPTRVSNANPTRVSNANPAQTNARSSNKNMGPLEKLLQKHPAMILLVFLIPFFLFILINVLSGIVRFLSSLVGSGSFFP